MGIFDAINISEGAMNVHRFRSEIAAENIANIHTAGYKRKEVELTSHSFGASLERARMGGSGTDVPSSTMDANDGAVRVRSVHTDSSGPQGERQDALISTTEMLRAKSAFELNVRAATLLKSMATSSLEIGRGG
jgi:flagellar basal body rod protein FlgC